MDFSNIKVIVFDLDGTLYEDMHHFDYQAARLRERLPKEKQPLFDQDYIAIKHGKHPLKIGRVFDVVKDLILVQFDNRVKEAYDWNGNRLSEEEIHELYPVPIELNFTTMLSVGDPWWTSISVAAHYGLDSRSSYDAFLETREFMMGPEFEMEPINGFKETLEDIHGRVKLALLTNSPEPDSEAILSKLGLDQMFDLKIFNGQKPNRTEERFATFKEQFGVEYHEILSVGDNWINEIHPVQGLGCATIFIDPYDLGLTADLVVRRMGKAMPLLRKVGTPF